MSFEVNNLATKIANAVFAKFGHSFFDYPSQVKVSLVRAEAWLVVASMEDSEISAASVSKVIDAELSAESFVEKEIKRLSKKR